MLTIIAQSFFAACGAGLLTLIIMIIKWLRHKIKCDMVTVRAVAHDSYYRCARELLKRDKISDDELENFEFLYKAYKAQGLNGTGDRIHEQIMEKEVVMFSPEFMKKMP